MSARMFVIWSQYSTPYVLQKRNETLKPGETLLLKFGGIQHIYGDASVSDCILKSNAVEISAESVRTKSYCRKIECNLPSSTSIST
mmetsp:Transcript_76055/g.134304  ORF Transcript_76055/g.134304 Transcript_76055/m.134304 type:complete len:86 (+) Transcript_76055:59-316(+)